MAISPLFTLANGKGDVFESKGAVEFIPNTDPQGPVDPTDPDPINPVNPIDPDPRNPVNPIDPDPRNPVNPIDPDPRNPVNSTDPDPGNLVKPVDSINSQGPNIGTGGSPLSLDYVSNLDFGISEIANTKKGVTYYANAQELHTSEGSKYVPNYVQISDYRGTNSGWTLTIKQEGQFSNASAQHKELTGSQIQFVDPIVKGKSDASPPIYAEVITLDPNGAESLVMAAKPLAGAGLWVESWGAVEEMTGDLGQKIQKIKAISFTIPGETQTDTVTYSTKLTWKLSDIPSN
ncbi:WxL domain-containing protein [Lysinibacillus agricola]|uniref:WxL domain-containing protein n=1 Tax=Lysinibacillus agricola TaxID=2590012 RepID=A0ABX7AT13_9BACI|nr:MULTISPECIES: WxL domain-containing protein [Lysinibacillus]KOS63087.1 cell surface protein [Lysinibacillus sp. FJAT-14222]QQP12929.1 WxL domain-containing protein [Lysinibacillus agricola]